MPLKFEELKNKKIIKIVAASIILLIMAIISLKGYGTLNSKNIKLKAEIAKKRQEISSFSNISSLKAAVNSEIKELEAKLSSLEKGFPSSNTEEVFSSLNRFVEASQISLKAISPLEKIEIPIPDSKDKYLELPINLKLECSYDQLLAFLNKIENANKIMIVTEVKIQSNPDNIWEHNIELSLKIPMLSLQSRN